MPNYAIHDGKTVINVIVADSAELAESLTGMSATEVTDDAPWIGWTLEDNGVWKGPQPYPSWVWTGEAWEAPIEQPTPEHMWDEDVQDWVLPRQFFPEG